MIDEPTRHLFTVDDYYRMGEVGILGPEERVELFEGEILVKESKTPPHAHVLDVLNELFMVRFACIAHVRNQSPVRLSRWSEPEPDLAVVRGGPWDYQHGHPSSPLLVVEVADWTLARDRRRKGALYARAGIADYWIVNLVDLVLEVYRDAVHSRRARHGWEYRHVQVLPREATISPLAAAGARIAVADILPPP